MPISTIGANGLNKTEDFTIDGLTVGKGGGNVSNNTVVGLNAGVANTTGKITAVGYLAARFNTTGSGNTAIGGNDGAQDGALYLNTTGNYNIAMGTGAVASNTTGSNNTGIGYSALQNSTTADNNTAVGYTAMYTNTTGQGNTALGRRALYSNTTASDNTAIGNQALYTNSTGTANVAVGQNALVSNTTATRNTAVGYQAGYALTTGGANVVVGDNAFKTATTADNTVAIGTYALENTTGIYNTAVGAGAGGAITSGAKNTIIGRYNGNQGGLDIRTASNYIVLSDGDGNPRIWVTNSNVFYAPGIYANTSVNAANVVAYGANGDIYRSTSSARYKTEITDSTRTLDDLLKLRPVTYKNINPNIDKGQTFGGLIAEEVHAAGLTEFVMYNEDNQPESLAYGNMVSLCINAIKELNAKVEALEAKLASK